MKVERKLKESVAEMDGRFHFGHCIRISGPSQCGKTCTLQKILCTPSYFYPHPPKTVVWISGSGVRDEKLEEKIRACYPQSEFHYEIPDSDAIPEMVREHDFWVFDDAASELKNNTGFTNFFTKTAHHKNCLMAYLTQNAYESGADAVTRARNCNYQIYFPNKSDVRWERSLGDQLLGNASLFKQMFAHATKQPYSCLLCDNRATTAKQQQFIANAFFPTAEQPTKFLLPNARNGPREFHFQLPRLP